MAVACKMELGERPLGDGWDALGALERGAGLDKHLTCCFGSLSFEGGPYADQSRPLYVIHSKGFCTQPAVSRAGRGGACGERGGDPPTVPPCPKRYANGYTNALGMVSPVLEGS